MLWEKFNSILRRGMIRCMKSFKYTRVLFVTIFWGLKIAPAHKKNGQLVTKI